MVVPQKKIREITLQVSYLYDFSSVSDPKSLMLFLGELGVTRKTVYYVFDCVKRIFENVSEIDLIITQFLDGYAFERVTRIEKNILRLMVFELKNSLTLPNAVAVTEAIRLTRKFGTRESAKFVHGVLYSIIESKVLDWKLHPELNVINH